MKNNEREEHREDRENLRSGVKDGMPSSGDFREEVWEDQDEVREGVRKTDVSEEEGGALSFLTNWFSGLKWLSGDDEQFSEDEREADESKESMMPDFKKNWKKYAIAALVLLVFFNVIWTLMDKRIGSTSGSLAQQEKVIASLKKEVAELKSSLAASVDVALKEANQTVQSSLKGFDKDLAGLKDTVSSDRLVLARHEEYLRRSVADRKSELRTYARSLRSCEQLLTEGGSLPLPAVRRSKLVQKDEKAQGPIKSTLQLTQDSLSITKETLAITRDALDKARADIVKREKDNAALVSQLESAKRDLLAAKDKAAQAERSFKEQAVTLSTVKADLAVSQKGLSDLKLNASKAKDILNEQKKSAERALAIKDADIKKLKAVIASRDQELKGLEAASAKLRSLAEESKGQLVSLKEELTALKADVVKKAKELSEKSALLESARKVADQMTQASAAAKEALAKATAEKDKLLSQAQSKVDGFVAQLKDAELFSSKAQEEIEALKQQLQAKTAQLTEALQSISAHEERQRALEEKISVLEKSSVSPENEEVEAPQEAQQSQVDSDVIKKIIQSQLAETSSEDHVQSEDISN
ncbi:MAG: hypothetical protein CSA35_05630 [Dethiosulfovibrio peptidovorans]|nr:MAG: hypothetical protein CSA35_05630 [Dethiosulfovibrio peptidovorans]